MARDHALMYVLSAIILLNIIAIVLLQSRVETSSPAPVQQAAPQATAPVVIRPERPDVRTVLLEAPCECFNISLYIAALNDTIDMQIEETRDAALFGAQRLPAIAFNATFASYPTLTEGWEEVGSIVNITSGEYAGTWYVLPTQNAPFYENGTVHGQVAATYLVMESCEECYSIDVLREEMEKVGITPHSERIIDVSSAAGRQLVQRYNITIVPTLIMDEQAKYYALLGWDIVGTVEEDGSYVLRDLQRMRVTYYDMQYEKVMRP